MTTYTVFVEVNCDDIVEGKFGAEMYLMTNDAKPLLKEIPGQYSPIVVRDDNDEPPLTVILILNENNKWVFESSSEPMDIGLIENLIAEYTEHYEHFGFCDRYMNEYIPFQVGI